MKLVVLILTIAFFISHILKGQSDDFKRSFSEATLDMYNENYESALKKLQELNKLDPQNSNVLFQMGYCFLQPPVNPKKAIDCLQKASSNVTKEYKEGNSEEGKAPIEVFKYLGDAYHLNYQFETAIATYERFLRELDPKATEQRESIQNQIKICRNAIDIKKFPLNMRVTNMGGQINSIYADYNPCITVDDGTMVFTSRREESTGGKFEENGKYFEDVFITHRKDGEWSKPVPISTNINTEGHESAINISSDGQTLLIYKYDFEGQGDIYLSKLLGKEWGIPTKMGSDINSAYWEGNASISADGQYFYFSSERPGGYGGKDIYFCKKLPTGDWALAQNCGAEINTASDEEAPFIHPDGVTLFFSSNGHRTMGGYDVFFSEKLEDKRWSETQNLGYPVNTPADDIHFKPTADRRRAYYSSFRSDGFGDYDIYMVTFPEIEEIPLTVFKGTVANEKGEVPADLVINVNDATSNKLIGTYVPNSSTGKYIIILHPGKVYNIEYQTDEGVLYTEKFDVPAGTSYQEIDRAINLPPLKIANPSKN